MCCLEISSSQTEIRIVFPSGNDRRQGSALTRTFGVTIGVFGKLVLIEIVGREANVGLIIELGKSNELTGHSLEHHRSHELSIDFGNQDFVRVGAVLCR